MKPDDQWEANEVADRCPSVVERLLAVLQQRTQNERAGWPELLDADLVEPAR